METLAMLAFAGLILAQFAAVIAVSTINREGVGAEPNKASKPQPGFAARFAKSLDEETAKLYRTLNMRAGGRPPRGYLTPFYKALMAALRPTGADHSAATPATAAIVERPRAEPEERFAPAEKLRAAA